MTRLGLAMAAAVLAAVAPARAVAPLPEGGTVALQPKTVDGDYDPATATFGEAAAEALGARGFTILPDDGHAALVAELLISRQEVGTGLAKAKGGGITPMGMGVAIPFSTGKSQVVPLVRTRLEMRVHRRGDPDVAWHAAAVTVREAGTATGADKMVAADLVRALISSYPIVPRTDIGVP